MADESLDRDKLKFATSDDLAEALMSFAGMLRTGSDMSREDRALFIETAAWRLVELRDNSDASHREEIIRIKAGHARYVDNCDRVVASLQTEHTNFGHSLAKLAELVVAPRG